MKIAIGIPELPTEGGCSITGYHTHYWLNKLGYKSLLLSRQFDSGYGGSQTVPDPMGVRNVKFFRDVSVKELDCDIIIGKGSVAPLFLKEQFPDTPLIYWETSLEQLHLWYQTNKKAINIPATEVIKKKLYFRKDIKPDSSLVPEVQSCKISDAIMPTSDLDKTLFHQFYPEHKNKILDDVCWGGYVIPEVKWIPFLDRTIDVLFAGDWTREIRCFKTVKDTCMQLRKMGFNVELLGNPFRILDQDQFHQMLSNTKVVVNTSIYESKSNLIIEGLAHGCNAVCTNNIGASALINQYGIVEKHDVNEFVEKIVSNLHWHLKNKLPTNEQIINVLIKNCKKVIENEV